MNINYIIIYLAIAALIGYIGKDKKFGFWGNFAVAALLTPVAGIVCYFAQSKKGTPAA